MLTKIIENISSRWSSLQKNYLKPQMKKKKYGNWKIRLFHLSYIPTLPVLNVKVLLMLWVWMCGPNKYYWSKFFCRFVWSRSVQWCKLAPLRSAPEPERSGAGPSFWVWSGAERSRTFFLVLERSGAEQDIFIGVGAERSGAGHFFWCRSGAERSRKFFWDLEWSGAEQIGVERSFIGNR